VGDLLGHRSPSGLVGPLFSRVRGRQDPAGLRSVGLSSSATAAIGVEREDGAASGLPLEALRIDSQLCFWVHEPKTSPPFPQDAGNKRVRGTSSEGTHQTAPVKRPAAGRCCLRSMTKPVSAQRRQAYLEDEGLMSPTASDGDQAGRQPQELLPDLVISDRDDAPLDAIELLRRPALDNGWAVRR